MAMCQRSLTRARNYLYKEVLLTTPEWSRNRELRPPPSPPERTFQAAAETNARRHGARLTQRRASGAWAGRVGQPGRSRRVGTVGPGASGQE